GTARSMSVKTPLPVVDVVEIRSKQGPGCPGSGARKRPRGRNRTGDYVKLALRRVARAGIEPATTPAGEGQPSPANVGNIGTNSPYDERRGPESTRRHHGFQACALPTELPRRASSEGSVARRRSDARARSVPGRQAKRPDRCYRAADVPQAG